MLLLLWLAIYLLVVIGCFLVHPILGLLSILVPVAMFWSALRN